jgi:hypothetical protein
MSPHHPDRETAELRAAAGNKIRCAAGHGWDSGIFPVVFNVKGLSIFPKAGVLGL